MKYSRKQSTQRRHQRIRRKLSGTAERPRLAVFRSNNHIYVQLVDDVAQHTLACASTVDPELKTALGATANCDASGKVGELIAKRALEKGLKQVVFDRGGNIYHGRIKALAEGARSAGLDF
ncbi:MAG: 50S ribosomal protein L18 [Synechococcales cyanobacterium RM1_1_8]|nr:50S ribosomal protein L18 [Synechococcales cyanobacterium RM1_1_8]